jgi:hypothetical protein
MVKRPKLVCGERAAETEQLGDRQTDHVVTIKSLRITVIQYRPGSEIRSNFKLDLLFVHLLLAGPASYAEEETRRSVF